jgi:signal transduction histidine kinase
MLVWRQVEHLSFYTRLFLGPLIVGLGYFAGAEAAFFIGTLSDNFFAPFWPPNTVLFCALVFVPYRQWWRYIAAVLPFHILVEWQVAMPPAQIVVAFVTNCAVAILNALFIKQLLVSPPWLSSFPRALLFVIGTVCVNPAVVAFGGAFVRISMVEEMHQYWTYWAQWYAANALASLTLGPILLVLAEQSMNRAKWPSRRQTVEALLVGSMLGGACALVFAGWPSAAIVYLPLPLVLWSTVRFGIKGASGAILIVTVTAVSMALDGLTVFASTNSEMNVLALQLCLTGFAVPVLLLGASIEGVCRAEITIRELVQTLLSSYDEERRRTAKELHEGVCQDLAAASLMASRVADLSAKDLRRNARQLERQLQKSMQDLRSASYLLHPPLLDESGLEPALNVFVERFSRRTNITVSLAVSPALGRLPFEVEICLFRFAQDALTNISRSSDGLTARIRAEICGTDVVLSIAEEYTSRRSSVLSFLRRATFVPPPGKQSVGIAAMRERLHRVGGKLELDLVRGKTVLKAVIPVGARVEAMV